MVQMILGGCRIATDDAPGSDLEPLRALRSSQQGSMTYVGPKRLRAIGRIGIQRGIHQDGFLMTTRFL